MKLFDTMAKLEFEKVACIFNDNYMKGIPFVIPLFVEIEEGLYNKYYQRLELLYEILKDKTNSLRKKMDIKVKIKNVYKNLTQYVINVPIKYVSDLDSFYMDSEMKVCTFDKLNIFYNQKTGFKLDLQLPPEQSSAMF